MPRSEQSKLQRKAYTATYNQRPEVKQRVSRYNAEYQANPANKQRRREAYLKLRKHIWDLLGPVCQRCGYDKSIAALHFHHLNPLDKANHKDTLGVWLCSKSLEYITGKIRTTPHIILCANCHAEEHDCEK